MQRSGRPLLAIEGQQDGTVAVHVDWLGTLDQWDVAQPGAPLFSPPGRYDAGNIFLHAAAAIPLS